MPIIQWDPDVPASRQLADWCREAAEPGLLHAVFSGSGSGTGLSWRQMEPWVRSRAVTVAEIRTGLRSPALDVALCADQVYLDGAIRIDLGAGELSPPVVWALGRAGRAALARGLLDPTPISADEAVTIGLAHGVLKPGVRAPVSERGSLTALTVARDLMRSSASLGPSRRLELAAFRLLFAAGDPREGALAFLERRKAVFD